MNSNEMREKLRKTGTYILIATAIVILAALSAITGAAVQGLIK